MESVLRCISVEGRKGRRMVDVMEERYSRRE